MQFHQMKATLKKEVSCPLCQNILSSERSLLSHTRFVHERSERYQCKTCEKLLSSSLALKGHNLRHENFHNFICVVCDKKFSQKVHLKSHMLLHSGTKPHKCPFCANTYVDKNRMQDHIHNLHEEAKLDNFKCDNCQKLFKYRIAPSHKIVCETLDYSDTQIVCRLCGEKLTSISVKDHWKLHSNKIQSLKCSFCEKVFIQPVHKRAHEKSVHHKIKEFGCKICPQRFAKSPSVEAHMKTQHQDKTYKCQFCTSSFKLKSSLTDHQKFHDATRRFACEVCGLRFHKKELLHTHRGVHAKEKVPCSKCNMELKSRVGLVRHDREQHQKDIEWVSCKECNYRSKRSLKRHTKVVHMRTG